MLQYKQSSILPISRFKVYFLSNLEYMRFQGSVNETAKCFISDI